MYNIISKNVWTGEKKIIDTSPSAYYADRAAMRLLLNDDSDHITYMEPSDGWEAETARECN